MADYDAIVIGAGLGGLSAGALLAREGRSVLVVEQTETPGGCCSTFQHDGFCFDVGASIVESTSVLASVFEQLGTRLEDELDLVPCDPIMTVVLRDETRIGFPADRPGLERALARIDPAAVDEWRAFVDRHAPMAEALGATLFGRPANGLSDLLAMARATPTLLRYLPAFGRSYQEVLERSFGSHRIRESFAYQTSYFGLPPELLPGAMAFILYTEHLGVAYPRGGMIQIPNALLRIGQRAGLEVRYRAPVARVLVERGRAIGVRLADGTEIRSDVVVSDVNARTLYQRLIGEEHLPWLTRQGVRSYRPSITCPMVYLGLDAPPPLDAHHTLVAPTVDELNAWWWSGERLGVPARQWGLVAWPTLSDPSLAPAGRHVLAVTTTGAYQLPDGSWDEFKPRFIEDVIGWLERTLGPGIAGHVVAAACTSPLDWERRLGLPHGAIYGFQQDPTAQLVFRPANRSKSIKGLYLAGASSNPGGGVPTTVVSGSFAARLVAQDDVARARERVH